MVINFLSYFQIQAAARNDVPFLLQLDHLLANAAIDRQESGERQREQKQTTEFEKTVEGAFQQMTSERGGQSAKASD